jgi:cell division protein FtsB
MTKRFKVYKVIGSFHEWSVEDTVDDKVVFGSIMHKYEADRLCDKLNELHEENQQLKKEIENLKQGLIHAAFDKEWK